MRRARACGALFAALLASALPLGVGSAAAAASDPDLPSFQELVDQTPTGGVLRPPPGVYAGPVLVRRPLRIEGGGEVVIDAGGHGTVVQLLTDGASLRGLVLRNSGENHDTLDAGVQVRGNGNVIEDNVIEDCLFGVDLKQADGNVIRGNRIGSKALEMGVRGDGIRLWYSKENEIRGNQITDVRDVVVWYSGHNIIAENHVIGGRYALHFMYSEYNLVERNRYEGNMVGVFLMYSDGVELRNNFILGAQGPTGMGVGFKESSNVLLEGNDIVYCAKGIYLDISPYQPDTENRFIGNRLAYNGTGVVFHSDWHGNVFKGNDFLGNFTQVAVRGGGSAKRNTWVDNHWDDFRGFDRNGDGRGDTPYELFSYSDQIWQEMPKTEFFRSSLLFEAIDFLDRLAPFMEPTLVLRDTSPRFSARADAPRARP
jgi:nitrous oxidase accessory protein